MSQSSGNNIKIFIIIVALITASLACNYPDASEAIIEAAVEDCHTVSRDSYERAAAQLRQDLDTPDYPENAIYQVCYINQEPISAKMFDGDQPEDEVSTIPMGTYIGESNFYSTLENDVDDSYLEPECTENTVNVVIGSDGTAEGELRSICYANRASVSEEGQVTRHSEVTGIIQGELLDIPGQLSIAYTWHSYITGPQCTPETPCSEDTVIFDFLYNVNVSNDVMAFTPAGEVEDYYSFELTQE